MKQSFRGEAPQNPAEDDPYGEKEEGGGGGSIPGSKKGNDSKSKTPVLDNFGRDLTKAAEEGKLDPIVGREKEIERVSQILSRRKKNTLSLLVNQALVKVPLPRVWPCALYSVKYRACCL